MSQCIYLNKNLHCDGSDTEVTPDDGAIAQKKPRYYIIAIWVFCVFFCTQKMVVLGQF